MSSKIFGIGIGRTGTTSLTQAMKILGYKSLHFVPNLHPNIIKKADFICDTPVPARYKELDHLYPGSRFIYTIRDPSKWLKSVKWLFEILGEAPKGKMELRKETYGSAFFNKTLNLKRYREHDEDVRRYFKERPKDILIINICAGEGWEKLCPFLGIDKFPPQPFPHLFKSGSNG